MTEKFSADYYLRGEETGQSNYTGYKWRPDETMGMASQLRRFMGMKDGDSLLEIGCARGYYVKALRRLGIEAWGQDISEWAIANCDPEMRKYVSNNLPMGEFDYIFSKDTFEHIPHSDLTKLAVSLIPRFRKSMFVIVPLTKEKDGEYVHPKEEKDPTHVNRWTLPDWLFFFESISGSIIVNGSYRYPGLKPGAYEVEAGYGFFTITKQ